MKLLIIFFLTLRVINSQTDFEPFSNPKKQFEFEKKRIYITDEKGTRQYTFGGGSKTVLANPLHPITGDEPKYVSKHNPIVTRYTYYHNFSMERNGQKITELDLLTLLGLEEEKQNIINKHKRSLESYEEKVRLINKDPIETRYKKVSPLTSITGDDITTEYFCYFPCATIGFVFGFDFLFEGNIGSLIKGLALFGIILIDYSTPVTQEIKYKKSLPAKPSLKQSMSNNQIKGLVKTYNRNLYNQITNK